MLYELYQWVKRKNKPYCLISYLLLGLCFLGYLGLIWFWLQRIRKQKHDNSWRRTYLNKILSRTTKKNEISSKTERTKSTPNPSEKKNRQPPKSNRGKEKSAGRSKITSEQPKTTTVPSSRTSTNSDADYSFRSELPGTTKLPNTSTSTTAESDYSLSSEEPTTEVRERRKKPPYRFRPTVKTHKIVKKRDFFPDAMDKRGRTPKKYRERTWYDDEEKEEDKPTVSAINLPELTTNPKIFKLSKE